MHGVEVVQSRIGRLDVVMFCTPLLHHTRGPALNILQLPLHSFHVFAKVPGGSRNCMQQIVISKFVHCVNPLLEAEKQVWTSGVRFAWPTIKLLLCPTTRYVAAKLSEL